MRNFFTVVLLLILSFFSWQPLLSPGFFTIHDNQQIVRLAQLDKSLSFGQFPVRWTSDLGFGFGYPLFNFYPPLVYYLGEIIHLGAGTGFIDSIKIVWFLALVGSALTMYFLAKVLFGKVGAVVAAAFYLYVPYHAVDAYVRGALAELFSFVWLPLILLFSYQKKTIITGVFLALLMLTHNLIFLPFLGFFVIWSLALKNYRFPISLLIAFGLTVFFWLPALWEKQYTLVDQLLISGPASYKLHFVCLPQLWNSLWGYGGSTAGCLDGLSFKIGKPHLIFVLLSAVVAFWKRSRLIFTLILLFLGSVFMTTAYSKFIWDNIAPLWYLQFPWRFLEFAALFSSLLAGSLFMVFKKKSLLLPIAALAIISVIYLHGKYFVPQTYLNTTDVKETSDEQVKWVVSSTSFEYLPRGGLWLDVSKDDVAKTKYQIVSGTFSVTKQNFFPDRFVFTGVSSAGATLRFNTVNFPGWIVFLDGKPTIIDDKNKYKLITVKIDSGQHQIVGAFMNTPVRNLGNSLTIVSILVLGISLYGTRRNKT